MVIVTNTNHIKKGEGQRLIDRFNKVGKIEYMEGFLGLEVLFNENTKDYDEVTISTRWDSKDDFTAWTKSDAFREAHSRDPGGRPDYIIDNKISFYEVKIVRNPIVPA
ncbi:heme-degrading monooxygenase [Siminovitchia terrae]|uniref:Heme-degrading monooxygenase n=1 Tax=Siminovitchia terrae TaxID=1914933 RepID=A0ABQ4L060_SIMTE|nr:heme oxygenase [Siminovitchia terrae]GIN92394.1 heme-degrading monooxygenase [Siminovitchia terrae]GIN97215.1 heme-degrading monooxygenase [Siminovitchia terrae]